jgi:hypothetical protein
MPPKLIVEPISENNIIVELSSGITIQITDTFPLGGEIQISRSRGKFENNKRKIVNIVLPSEKDGTPFQVEVKAGY